MAKGGLTISDKRDVMGYNESKGPINNHSPGVGLRGGINYGNQNQPVAKVQSRQGPVTYNNHGCCGSQGKH